MLRAVLLLTLSIYYARGDTVEVLPAAPVAPAIVTSRSSQYFIQNHNSLAAPLVAPAVPVAPTVPVAAAVAAKPVAARIESVAPARLEVAAPVSPAYQFIAPSASSVSQVTRYAQYYAPAVGQYVAAPYVISAPLVAPAAPLLANPVVAPLVARAPAPVQPVAAVQPLAPQQPGSLPAGVAPNPDSESVDIESARVRALPENRRQSDQQRAFQGVQSQNLVQNRRQSAQQAAAYYAQSQNLVQSQRNNFAGYQNQGRGQNQL